MTNQQAPPTPPGCLVRAAACLLQVLFALNRRYFLHEKRAVAIATGFALRPPGFAEILAEGLASSGASPAALTERVERMTRLAGATAAICAAERA